MMAGFLSMCSNCLTPSENIVKQLKHLQGFAHVTQRRSSKIQPTSKSMDELHCSQEAERAGSLKILLYPYLLNPCGRLNAACCEISTRIARLLDLALRNFHLGKCLHDLLREDSSLRRATITTRWLAKTKMVDQ